MARAKEVYVLFLLPDGARSFDRARVAGVYSSEAAALHDMAQHTDCDLGRCAVEKCRINEWWANWDMKF